MPFGKFIVIPIFVAIQAASMMLLAPFIKTLGVGEGGLATWIAFQAWAMYFLAGCKVKTALKVLVGYVGGIAASIVIFELGDYLAVGAGMDFYWGYAIAVLIIVVPVISMEKVPGLNLIPAWFIGAGVFFGIMGLLNYDHNVAGYKTAVVPEVVACAVGLAYGWVTVTFRGWYEAKVSAGAQGTRG